MDTSHAYRLFFEKLPHGVMAMDPAGALLAANPAAAALLGVPSVQALLGYQWIGAIAPAQRADALSLFSGPSAGAPGRLMLQLPVPGEPTRMVELQACPLPEAAPAVSMLATLHEAGLRAREFADLRDREALYRLFAEGTNDFITLREPDGRFVYGSQTFLRQLGRAPAPSLDELLERFHPDDREMGRKAWDEVVAGRSRYTTFRYLNADGSWHWLEAWGTLVSYRGRPHVLSVSRDITARVRAQEMLRHSEERFRVIVEAWVDLVGIVDDAGRFTYSSPSCLQLLGLQPADVSRLEDLWSLTHPDDSAQARAGFAAVVGHAEAPASGPVRMRAKDGRWLSIEWRFNDLRGNPAIDGIVVYAHDMTGLMALQSQLHQAQKLESVGRFAGGIAHDFNNVLAGVLGLADLAQKKLEAGHAATELLRQIERAATRGRDLARQILTFARQQPLVLRSVELASVVADAAALAGAALPAGVRLELKLADEAVHVQGDPVQIEQVVSNLIVNAAQALPSLGGAVEVGVSCEDLHADDVPRLGASAAGPHAHLWVRDTGCGMDAATRERIFEPFFTTKAAGSGTGLGLSVVHGIVKAHGGAIAVDSAPGSGSTFHVYWPERAPAAAAAPAPPAAEPPGRGELVVVVDDDEVLLLATSAHLERLGYAVQACQNVPEALAAVQRGAVRLVVSDLHIGGESGLDLARRVQALRPDLPLVLMSGYVSEALEHAAHAIGVRAVLPKGQLLERLGNVVDGILGAAVRD